MHSADRLKLARQNVELEHGLVPVGSKDNVTLFQSATGAIGVVMAPEVKDDAGNKIGVDFYFQMNDGSRIDIIKLRKDDYSYAF